MALIITTTIPLITPVYTPLEFVMTSPGCDYMELDVYVGDSSKGQYDGTKRTIRIVSTSVTADIQGIVQPFFRSDASGTVELKRIDVVGRTVTAGTPSETYVDCYWVFNGCKRDSWNFTNFMMNASFNGQFLNNWDAPINIHKQDKDSKLYFFHGLFGNTASGSYDVSKIYFKTTTNGVPSAGFSTLWNNSPRIYTLPADPSSLTGLTFNSNTTSYTIDPSRNTTNIGLKTFNITAQDERYTPKRVQWVDSMGCINGFNFDLLQTNSVEMKKDIFNNNGTFKQYNNKVTDSYTLTSNWITEKESLALKDLWYSPSVMIDGQYVIIQNKSMDIKTRREVKLINYTLEYQKSNDYKVQIN